MRKTIVLLTLIFAVSFKALAASVLKQDCTLLSRTLDREVRYTVYLPDGYDSDERSYPVLYLLHGLGDDHRSWSQQGEVKAIADRAIAAGEAAPMIIIMPDAGKSWYVDSYDKREAYETMFFEELIPHIDRTFRTRTEKEYRAVAGLSMGGYGALVYALHRPELFSASCPLSAAVFTDEELADRGGVFPELFSRIFGPEILTEHWTRNSVLALVQAMPEGQKNAVRFRIDCGDDDFLYRGNSALHVLMRNRGIPHEYRVRDGGHTWTYWRTALPEVLAFVSRSFRRS